MTRDRKRYKEKNGRGAERCSVVNGGGKKQRGRIDRGWKVPLHPKWRAKPPKKPRAMDHVTKEKTKKTRGFFRKV